MATDFGSLTKCDCLVMQQFYLYPSEIIKDMFKHSAPRMLVITLISEELETNVPKLDMWHSYIIKCVKNDIVTLCEM